MRLRIVIIVTLTVAAYAVAALVWRQVFPFRDGIAQFLPEGTIAYVHVNLTPVVRRALRLHLDTLGGNEVYPKKYDRIFLSTPFLIALRGAITETDVRELGFVWHQPESLPPQLSFIVGQRASAQPDVMPAETIMIGGQEVRAFVVRIRSSGRNPPLPLSFPLPSRGGEGEKLWRELRRQPVQAVLWPRELPIPALEAARYLLPETVTALGTVGRRGFVLRSDGRIPLIVRSTRTELLAEPRPGTFQIIGLPVRAIAEQLDLPFHGELRATIEPILPETADFLVDGDRIAARIDTSAVIPPEVVLRSLVARLWPVARPRRLDGLSAIVLVADPKAIEVSKTGPSRWVLKTRDGATRIFVERSGDSVYLATDEELLGSALLTPSRSPSGRGGESEGAGLRIPSACHLDGQSAFIVWPIHPQAVVTMSVDLSGSSAAFCGRILQLGI